MTAGQSANLHALTKGTSGTVISRAAESFTSPRNAKSKPDGRTNHCVQFGLASQEQRWGIEGASFGVALGDLH